MVVRSARPAANGCVCPAADGCVRSTANGSTCSGHPFHVCARRLVTTTPAAVHGDLLRTVLGRRSTSTRYGRFVSSRPLVETAR
jgi:hypothetical protein